MLRSKEAHALRCELPIHDTLRRRGCLFFHSYCAWAGKLKRRRASSSKGIYGGEVYQYVGADLRFDVPTDELRNCSSIATFQSPTCPTYRLRMFLHSASAVGHV